MNKLRMRFSKTGRAVYISHLDLMHTMQRAISRAGFSLKYSEGYNPHPQISIALPLSVGMSSRCEIMDLRLNEEVSFDDFRDRLNSSLPEGIEVLEVYEAEEKVSSVKWLRVRGTLEYDDRDVLQVLPKLTEFFERENIPVMKKSKRGLSETDIRPMIREIRFSSGGEGIVIADALISAAEPTLNPDLITAALVTICPPIAPDFASYERMEVFKPDMEAFR
ncbi:MAG: DUF2344 domain-containing protein [Oscillospiraceae bacterium]|nr:DUF2344 domain-containing protein [Oscillospiraceae bacterium]